ncbi:MAG: thioester domain-containing protein [Bacteroidales bacterium]|nr:thioester domain-containing protein [Bacteroidales bacterium]
MKRKFSSIGILSMMILLLISCEKNQDPADKGGQGGKKPNDMDMISYVIQNDCGGELRADLLAGRNTKAGELIVTLNANILKVTYVAGDGWAISETHLSVTNSLEEVPSNRGSNPVPGLFEHHSDHQPAVTGFTYEVSIKGVGEELFILAHAVVSPVLEWKTSLEGFSESLPETAVLKVDYPVPGSLSYFTTTITEGGILDGTYSGWCIDVGNVIYNNTDYKAKVISSFDPDFSSLGLVDKPENMDLVNWIINQDYPGKPATEEEFFTYGDVQRAIWLLLENDITDSGLDDWSQARVNKILEEADNNGKGFLPGCDDKIAIILLPDDMTQPFQITISPVLLTEFPSACEPVCGKNETAWAAGYDFGGSNWAMYFTYCIKE